MKAIEEYARLLGDSGNSGFVMSVKDLPLPQEEMLIILLGAYKTSYDQKYRDILKGCIIHLAYFVSTEDYMISVRWLELLEKMAEGDFSVSEECKQLGEENQRILNQAQKTMETYSTLIKKIDSER